MIKKGLALAFGTDAHEVARRLANRALQQTPEPNIGFLFSSVTIDQQVLFQTLKTELHNIPIYGTTSSLVLSNQGLGCDMAVLLLIASDDLDFCLLAGQATQDPAEVARYLGTKYLFDRAPLPTDSITCLITANEDKSQGIEYLKALKETFPFPIPISGGSTVGIFPPPPENPAGLHNGNQYCGDLLTQDYLNLLFMKSLDPEKVKFGYSFESSWEPVAPAVKCSRTEFNWVYEVDGRPIIEYLSTYLGEDFRQTLFYVNPRFSFITRLREGTLEKGIIQVPYFLDTEKNRVGFWPRENMDGKEIQLVQLSREDLLLGSRKAAETALKALGNYHPEAVFVFSCTVRSRLLHSQAGDEVECLKKVFGDEVPIIGLYCNSEFAPVFNEHADVVNPRNILSGSRQAGCSISIFAIGSKFPPAGKTNYKALLQGFFEEDRSRVVTTDGETIVYLRRMLSEAEKIISENERLMRYINNEHFKANLALKRNNEALNEAHQRNEKLKEVIRQYTPHEVWKKASVSVMAGLYKIPDEELYCALMFMDVKGFTSYAEKHKPPEVISELNRIFGPATGLIYQYGGDVDKYIGDCIFAKFNKTPDALRCALLIQKSMQELKRQGCPFSLRIGLNYGRVISGNVGGSMRRENALIGDAVNLAQRMEASCTTGSILLSGEFARQIDAGFLKTLNPLSKTVKVKGKEQELEVFEVPETVISAFPG